MNFTNQASVTYNNTLTASSNTVTGVYNSALSISKQASQSSYSYNVPIQFQITIANTGNTAVSGLTLTDNLGQYPFQTATRVPLTYTTGSASLSYYNNTGVTSGTVTVVEGATGLQFTFDMPATTVAIIRYEVIPNVFAPIIAGSTITNTVVLSGTTLALPLTASLTIPVLEALNLVVSKDSMELITVGENTSYFFTILNYGNAELLSSDYAVLSDTLPIPLTNVTVTANGVLWTNGVEYDYSPTSSYFRTNSGAFSLPPATITVDSFGRYIVSPSSLVIILSGIA